jgi:hypothetical protein
MILYFWTEFHILPSCAFVKIIICKCDLILKSLDLFSLIVCLRRKCKVVIVVRGYHENSGNRT